MRVITMVSALSLASFGLAQTVCQFQPAEKQEALDFWRQPTRYASVLPPDVAQEGLWQVRLTVAGSLWLWNYQGGKKNPLINARPSSARAGAWEKWIESKLARDRWEALQCARDANEVVLGARLPFADKQTPDKEPPVPGPIPADLLARSGAAPRLAEVVMPMEHRVNFDDVSLVTRDNPRLSNPRYAYYRSEKGILAGGVAVNKLSADKMANLCRLAGLSPAEVNVMKAVSKMEGGFESINTYDTGFVSVGFIQFASLSVGANSLGALLKTYKTLFPDDYRADFKRFGIDVTDAGVLQVLDLRTGNELTGPDANREIIEDKRLAAVFQRAGIVSDKYKAMQLKTARDMYLPSQDVITVKVGDRTITGQISDFVKSEAGLAILMDRKVNTGKLDPLPNIVKSLATELNIQSLSDLAPYEREIVAKTTYRENYLNNDSLGQPPASPRVSDPMSRGSSTSRSKRR